MGKEKIKNKSWWMFRFVFVQVLILFFCVGVVEMDYGATFKDMPDVVGQSLFLSSVESRVVYHMGMLQVTGSFLFLLAVCAYYLAKDKIKWENKNDN